MNDMSTSYEICSYSFIELIESNKKGKQFFIELYFNNGNTLTFQNSKSEFNLIEFKELKKGL